MSKYLLLLIALLTIGCAGTTSGTDDAAVMPASFVDNPAIRWKTMGRSVEGRPIRYTTFGKGEDVTLIFGAFHGSERASPHLPFYLADLLASEPNLLSADRKVVIVPILNPDGYMASTRRNANGVDLNRNYPTANWGEQPKKSRPIGFGPSPASEPETRAVLKFLEKIDPDKIVSIHQPLRCNNNDGPAGLPLAELMATYNGYPVEPYIGFPTPGSFGTYAGNELAIPMTTLELPKGSPDADFLDQIWKENKDALLAVINYDPLPAE